LELVEVFEEGAFGSRFIAREGEENGGLYDVVAENEGEAAAVVEVGVFLLHALAEGVEAELEEAGLDGADAAARPSGAVGPVLRRALLRLASIWRREDIGKTSDLGSWRGKRERRVPSCPHVTGRDGNPGAMGCRDSDVSHSERMS
jgi:hypothetical protein